MIAVVCAMLVTTVLKLLPHPTRTNVQPGGTELAVRLISIVPAPAGRVTTAQRVLHLVPRKSAVLQIDTVLKVAQNNDRYV